MKPTKQQEIEDKIIRIGCHIHDAYSLGLWTWQEAEDSLESLNVIIGDDVWLGMPLIPEEWQ